MSQLNNEETARLIPTQQEVEQALNELLTLRKDRAKKIDEFIAELQPKNSK